MATALFPLGHYFRPSDAIGLWVRDTLQMRRSPFFKELMRETGAVDYWKKTRLPGGCRWTGDDDFECD
jgi:hypothetical protein